MKKLSLYVFLGLLWCSVGFAEEILINCVIQDFNLKAIDKKDRPRFVGQTISLKIDTERKIITNINQDSNAYLIHGIEDQVELKISKIEKSGTASTTVLTRDLFLERSKKIVAKKKVTLSKDHKNLKKGTVITFENVKNFTAEEWFDIPVDDRRSLRDLKYAKKKYNTLPLTTEAAEALAKDKAEKTAELSKKLAGESYNYNSEIIVLDDKDNEIIYKYTGSFSTGLLKKGLEIKINDSRSITQKLLYKDLEFRFYNCSK
jgi:hypothetical protein